MPRDRPGAAVPADAELPGDFTVGDFADILSALSLATAYTTEVGDRHSAQRYADIQERLFFANPEPVLMVDEVFADRFGQFGNEDAEQILAEKVDLADIDIEAVRSRVRPDGEVGDDGVDIDID